MSSTKTTLIKRSMLAMVLATACSSGGGSGTPAGGGGRTGGGGSSSSNGGGGPGGGAGGAGGTGGAAIAGSGGAQTGSGGAPSGGAGGSVTGIAGASAGSGGATDAGGTGGIANTGGQSGSGGAVSAGGRGGGGGAAAAGTNGSAGAGAGAGGMTVTCPASNPVNTGTPTTVTVNLAAAPVATIGPDFMGIHTAVYDGAIGDATTAALLKAAGVTSLRYPGGSYADLYHWETHTGTTTPAAGAGSNTIYVAPEAGFGKFASVLQNVGANAFITVNFGMNSRATGPGSPKEAAAWVAYANGSATDTKVIGPDNSMPPVDFMTVGYWARLRGSAPLPTDDGKNFLRINHPLPLGIKLWEVGNEMYGNGYYPMYGAIGWEADYHLLYGSGTRSNNPALAPSVYGAGVAAFAMEMKAVDPTIQVGGIVTWPDISPSFNGPVLSAACGAMDFVVVHWYPGETLASLYTYPRSGIPALFTGLRAAMAAGCPAGASSNLPIAVTEWGPNTINRGAIIGTTWHPMQGAGTQTQIGGIFAAESYANFMEQGALALHWAQLHDNQYLLATPTPDTPGFGYHGQLIAHHLGASGDTVLPPPMSSSATLYAHATRRSNGTVGVMLTNVSTSSATTVTLNVTGGRPLACSGTRYAYTPIANNNDGPVSAGEPIASTTAGGGSSVSVVVPAQSVVVVRFPIQ